MLGPQLLRNLCEGDSHHVMSCFYRGYADWDEYRCRSCCHRNCVSVAFRFVLFVLIIENGRSGAVAIAAVIPAVVKCVDAERPPIQV